MEDIKNFEDFKQEVLNFANNEKPAEWRIGQAVFNYIEEIYGVARYVQFDKHVDCFYNDNAIDDFIKESYNVIKNTITIVTKNILDKKLKIGNIFNKQYIICSKYVLKVESDVKYVCFYVRERFIIGSNFSHDGANYVEPMLYYSKSPLLMQIPVNDILHAEIPNIRTEVLNYKNEHIKRYKEYFDKIPYNIELLKNYIENAQKLIEQKQNQIKELEYIINNKETTYHDFADYDELADKQIKIIIDDIEANIEELNSKLEK